MAPGDLYILGVVVTALFVAPFSALARVVILSWIVGHCFWIAGLPEPFANIFGQTCVLILGRRRSQCATSLIAWALAIPYILVNLAWIGGQASPVLAWWGVLGIALVQLSLLPWAIRGETLRAVTRAWHETTGSGLFRVGGMA